METHKTLQQAEAKPVENFGATNLSTGRKLYGIF